MVKIVCESGHQIVGLLLLGVKGRELIIFLEAFIQHLRYTNVNLHESEPMCEVMIGD